MVTRWVKSMFGKERIASSIPVPTLASEASVVAGGVGKRLNEDRWKSALAQDKHAFALNDLPEEYFPQWITEAMESNDMPKLRLVEEYAKEYDPEIISATLDMLRNVEQGEAEHIVTEGHLEAMTIMDRFFPRTEVNSMDEDEMLPAMREEKLRRYVLDNPATAHKVKELTSRGIYDPVSILDTLESVQSDHIPTPINDGLL